MTFCPVDTLQLEQTLHYLEQLPSGHKLRLACRARDNLPACQAYDQLTNALAIAELLLDMPIVLSFNSLRGTSWAPAVKLCAILK